MTAASKIDIATSGATSALGKTVRSKPQAVENPAFAALQLLLRVENDVRAAVNLRELQILMANETRKLCRSRQIFVVQRRSTGRFKVVAVSSVASTESNAPLNQSIEKLVTCIEKEDRLAETLELNVEAYVDKDIGAFESYPLRELLWTPLISRNGSVFAGLLQARETPWIERDTIVSERLVGTYAHAWQALIGRREPTVNRFLTRRAGYFAAAAAALLMFIPVPMSALAPAEIVARQPGIVSAPIEGVIEKVLVEPNTMVEAGQPLIAFADTTLRNKFEITEREVLVASAKLKRSNQLAFQDERGRRELGIARAELALRIAERDYARDLLDKAVVRAKRSGIVVFGDKKDLTGKPVTVGERLMELADPKRVLLRIDMPVADGQLLQRDAGAKVFLDSDPLQPLTATIVRADYQARAHDGSSVTFRALAELKQSGKDVPRLGVRGTAQVYGDDVPLGFYLFRRPITAARQWLGF